MGMIGGATSIAILCGVWSDGVLRKVVNWLKIPVETTISRIFKEVTENGSANLKASRISSSAKVIRK